MSYIKKNFASSWSSFKKKTDTGGGEKRFFVGPPNDQEIIGLDLIENGKEIRLVFDGSKLNLLEKLFSQFAFYQYVKNNFYYPEVRNEINESVYSDILDALNEVISINDTFPGTITNDGARVYVVSTKLLKQLSKICPPDISGLIISHYADNIYNLNIYFDVEFLETFDVSIDFFNFEREHSFDMIPKLFHTSSNAYGLIFSLELVNRFIASMCTKPFVICSGLSGSGKTKLAQAFVQWICESENQYKIIPVGADWTNREPLLGYPNGLDPKSYVTPDSGALQLILEASSEENQKKPYFMILDEMNLSHVERYFADFLSIMESKEKLKLYSGERRYSQYTKENEFDENYFIPYEIDWPTNLFIIGTVNIDETTYMFSPKVLDRANVIEFRITPTQMNIFFAERKELNVKELFLDKDKSKGGAGQNMAKHFVELAEVKTITKIPEIEGDDNVLNEFFKELQIVGSEFGYRSATEIELLITKLGLNGFIDEQGQPLKNNNKIDIAIMQKLLPKLHGSRKKLVGPLETLAGFCLVRIDGSLPDDQNKTKTLYQQFISEKRDFAKWEIKYSISFEKIERMLKNVIENGFTSYAEA
jgi:5-methylcytosine-specific restriction protein B